MRCQLQDKINLHNDHVSGKIKQLKHEIALAEAEAASINATLQALDGKQLEADEAIQELEDKRLAEQVPPPRADHKMRMYVNVDARALRVLTCKGEGLKLQDRPRAE